MLQKLEQALLDQQPEGRFNVWIHHE
jgi:hypothetical protein